MLYLRLKRGLDTGNAMLGHIRVEDQNNMIFPWRPTIERSWKDNTPNISCIPAGIYDLNWGRYHKGNYAAYELLDVPDRELVKIHRANMAHQLLGCIAPGELHCVMKTKFAVSNSRKTLDEIHAESETTAQFIIIEDPPC